jgi:proteasome beta subunit
LHNKIKLVLKEIEMAEKPKQMETGTTTVGVIADGAVVLGADRKATMGYLVSSKHFPKILQLNDSIAVTTAGVVGDAQALARVIKAELKLYELNEGEKPSVKNAAMLVSNILYSRRFYPYIVQLVVGGHDGHPRLFSLDPSGGMTEEKEYFSTGSGSVMAFGVLEDKFKSGLPVEDAKKLVARAVTAATKRDIASGGDGIDIVVIDSHGYKVLKDEEIKKLQN